MSHYGFQPIPNVINCDKLQTNWMKRMNSHKPLYRCIVVRLYNRHIAAWMLGQISGVQFDQLSKRFCHSIEISPKHVFWTHQRFLMCRKTLTSLIIFFTYGNKKKSFGAKSKLYGGWLIKSMFRVLKNAAVWADRWELALLLWRVIRVRRLVFLISLEDS